MSADVTSRQLQSQSSWRQLAVKNQRLREQSRLLLQELWLAVCRWEEACFQARIDVLDSQQGRAQRQPTGRQFASSARSQPRFHEVQGVCLGHDFEPEGWLYGIVVSHRWHEAERSSQSLLRLAGWSYEVQFGDPDDLFTLWMEEGDLSTDIRV